MKKITAIFLIFSIFFNLFGYRLVVEYMQFIANTQLDANLNKNLYDDSQVIEINVPFHVPYQSNWSDYQRYDGEIDITATVTVLSNETKKIIVKNSNSSHP